MAGRVAKKRSVSRPQAVEAPRSEGQRLLCALPDSLAAVATQLECTKQLVSYYRAGTRLPSSDMRAKLLASYAIPIDAWDRAPGAAASTRLALAPPSSSTLEQVSALAAALTEEISRGHATAAIRAKNIDALSKQLALKARLERDRELLEDRIVREHPMWRRIVETMLEALRPHPEAARAVAAALQELGVDATEVG